MSDEIVKRLRYQAMPDQNGQKPTHLAKILDEAADLIERQSAALAAKDAEIARWRAALDAAAWLRRNMKKGPLFWYIEGSSCAENFIAKMNILTPPGAEP